MLNQLPKMNLGVILVQPTTQNEIDLQFFCYYGMTVNPLIYYRQQFNIKLVFSHIVGDLITILGTISS